MDAVLRQSKGVCPFLKKASPATLRALSTSTRPKAAVDAVAPSPCGGTISKLQVLARRCPIMGQAMVAVQGSPHGRRSVAGLKTLAGHGNGKARLHTSRPQEARPVDGPLYREKGE